VVLECPCRRGPHALSSDGATESYNPIGRGRRKRGVQKTRKPLSGGVFSAHHGERGGGLEKNTVPCQNVEGRFNREELSWLYYKKKKKAFSEGEINLGEGSLERKGV